MEATRIRWCEASWNPVVGCDKITEGCDNCYAEALTVRFGVKGYPQGFAPTYKPHKLREPAAFLRRHGPIRIFVNSMSDLHHQAFTDDQRDSIYDVMLNSPHDFIVLTKRPQMMARYMMGTDFVGTRREHGWLARRGLTQAPPNIWLGASIELDKYTFRARVIAGIPAHVHFLSLEPLLGPLPSLSLAGIEWAIVGGESGPGFRPMSHNWARLLRVQADEAGVAFFFKQSAGIRTEMGITLDNETFEQYPLEHPADRLVLGHPATIGRWTGRHTVTGTPVSL